MLVRVTKYQVTKTSALIAQLVAGWNMVKPIAGVRNFSGGPGESVHKMVERGSLKSTMS